MRIVAQLAVLALASMRLWGEALCLQVSLVTHTCKPRGQEEESKSKDTEGDVQQTPGVHKTLTNKTEQNFFETWRDGSVKHLMLLQRTQISSQHPAGVQTSLTAVVGVLAPSPGLLKAVHVHMWWQDN